jgi:hypothetical protein
MKRKYQKTIAEIKQVINHEEKQPQQQINNIPDISLQLIFCFLSLKELPRIAQCNKCWNRVVAGDFFLKMYQNERISIDLKKTSIFTFFCLSPFRRAVGKLIFSRKLRVSNMRLVSLFTQLLSIELEIDFNIERNKSYDYSSSFILFPPSLLTLKLRIIDSSTSSSMNALTALFNAVSKLKQIRSFTLESQKPFTLESQTQLLKIVDFSFLSALENLETLNIHTDVIYAAWISIISAIRPLPKLISLDSACVFHPDRVLSILRQLCAHPGAPSLLKIIPVMEDIKMEEQTEFVHLLNQLPSLQFIQYQWTDGVSLSPQLCPFIQSLIVENLTLSDYDIESIISMSHLRRLTLYGTTITEQQFNHLCTRIGKNLTVLSCDLIHINFQFLFQTLSNCLQLKCLSISFKSTEAIACTSQLFQLRQCPLLQELEITIIAVDDGDDYQNDAYALQLLCEQMRSIFKLPSSLIPSLEKIEIKLKNDN